MAVALVATPALLARRPASASSVSAPELAGRVLSSSGQAWSGYAETSGALQVPDSDSFASLAQLLGENSQLRAWWRGPTDWRVDRIRGTGETDLFRNGGYTTRWVFESETATLAPVSTVRLPDASDLLPPTLGRSLLQGYRDDEVSRLPGRIVAGVDAPGLTLRPSDPAATVGHVDLWVDPATGLPLEVEVYGVGEDRPVLTSSFREVSTATPSPDVTTFRAGDSVRLVYEESVDVAAAANAFAPFDLPPTLAGLSTRDGSDPGAVGVYGRGATTLLVLPLRGQVAGPLRTRLSDGAAAQTTAAGVRIPVGPVGVMMTPDRGRGSGFLLTGTVNAETMQRAAAQLVAGL